MTTKEQTWTQHETAPLPVETWDERKRRQAMRKALAPTKPLASFKWIEAPAPAPESAMSLMIEFAKGEPRS